MAKKINVVRSNKNYGLTLSGKIGSRPELEEEYVQKFIVVDAKDGLTSLREALLAYEKGGAPAWAGVEAAQKQLEPVKAKLLAAGYTQMDLMKLTMDNSEAVMPKEKPPAKPPAPPPADKKKK